MKTRKVQLPVTIATLVSLVVLSAALLILHRSIKDQDASWEWVVHTREVLEQLQTTLTHVSDAEAAQRGFLLTGNELFAGSYLRARDAIPAEIRTLRGLTADNPRQQQSLAPLEARIAERLSMLEEVMAQRRRGIAPSVATLESGHLLKQAIQAQANLVRAEEQRLLAQRQERSQTARQELLTAVGIAAALSVFLIVLLWVISSRGAARLLAERAQIETIYRAVPVGLGYVGADLRLAELNDALVDAAGRPKADCIGASPAEVLPAPLGEQVGRHLAQVLRARHQLGGIEFHAAAGAERRDWLGSFYPVIDENEVRGIVLALLEVTQIKAAQRELIAANESLEQRIEERTARIAEANAELRAFAHTVAHDLRAPLRNVEGFATALLEDEAPRLSEDGKLFAARIVAAVTRMDRLITDLLAYSRLARAELQLDAVDTDTVLRTVLRDLETQVRESGARIAIAPGLPAVRANQGVLVQVLDNLVSNALKFVAPGVVPEVAIHASTDGTTVNLLIEDNGIGIAPEHHEHVFGVFERLHGHETYPGTGIGLAIVRKGLERMGGAVRILGRQQGGTVFEVTLPAAIIG
ncbi:sensor histidine kinase [Massilia sp. GCM10023247]|uniref:sensor histidine kinase n=1 Tax=Massilia sp. GCM10023247 TaxID=3252643 RepID=UPI00362138D3